MSADIKRRLSRLEDAERPGPEDERQREEERKRVREQAEHANYCGWGKEVGRWPLFEIAEGGAGDVFCTHDGKPVTDSRQILAECFYWQELEWGDPGLDHDEGLQTFYTLEGELAVSRKRFDLQHLLNH
jgi:hypothetical protein